MKSGKEYLYLFLESSSIRGCSKILKAQNKYIRWIWVFYLIVTTMGLIITIRFIIEEYLKYAVNLQTYIQMDSPEPFPDVSFCNHQPFSQDAFEKWKSKKILSPVEYNAIVRNSIKGGDVSDMIYYGFIRDDVSDYYQNLDMEEIVALSHTRKQFIFLCLLKWTKGMFFSGAGCNDVSIKISQFSHPHFFNCYTMKIVQSPTEFEELNLILSLGPNDAQLANQENSFLFSLFNQATGLRIVIHEPGSQPDITRQGINIEPNRMNEIIYKTEQVKHISTPLNPCTNSLNTFKDLENDYLYDFDLCVKSHLQQRVIKECKCYYREYIRFNAPNRTHPYCGRFINGDTLLGKDKYAERNVCVQNIQSLMAKTRKSLYESNICPKRCAKTNYKIKSSATKWRYSDWQINWVKKIADSFDTDPTDVMSDYIRNAAKPETYFDDKKANYTFLVIKRESNDTEIRNEQLVLTISALFSRIGGLCSLYIGFSFAVAIEILEFIYNSYVHKKKSRLEATKAHESIMTNTNKTAIEQSSSILYNPDQNQSTRKDTEEIWHPQERIPPNNPNENQIFEQVIT